jgi:hypothetical protein
MRASSTAARLLSKERRLTDVILRLCHEIGSYDSKRKPLVFFLGPLRGPFFHQGLEWFLFVLFLSVLAFTHVSRSLYLDLIGWWKTTHRLSIFAASRTYIAA